MEVRDFKVYEQYVPAEVFESLQRIAAGETIELVATEAKLSPAQRKNAEKAEDAHHVTSVLANVSEGVNGEQCIGKEQYFFTEPEDSQRTKDLKQKVASALCARCPIVSRCLEQSIEHEEEFGTWGGQSEFVRRQLIRKKYTNRRR